VPQRLLVTWNWLSAFLEAYLKEYDVYGAAFCISLYFNKTVSTLYLMKEGSDVNLRDCGKGTTSYYMYMKNPSVHINCRIIKHHFKIITDL
jgi:hypothetical protein